MEKKKGIRNIPTLRIFFAMWGHLRLTYIPRAIGTRSATRVIPEKTQISDQVMQEECNKMVLSLSNVMQPPSL